SVERLEAIGQWLAVNGDSIYGTQPGLIQGEGWCRTTRKANTHYLHVFEWPENGRIELADLSATHAHLLNDPQHTPLVLEQRDGRLIIQGPAVAPDLADT